MARPQIGDRIIASDRAVKKQRIGAGKTGTWRDRYTHWERVAENPGHSPKPVDGIYIGFRHVYEGDVHYPASYEEGIEFRVKDAVEVWLVVEHPRHNPARIFPEDAVVNAIDSYPSFYTPEDMALEKLILQILSVADESIPPAELIEAVKSTDDNIEVNHVRQAIWRLIDRQEVTLTADLLIEIKREEESH